MSQTNATVEDLLRRYAIACSFKQTVNRAAIEEHMLAWMRDISPEVTVSVRFVEDVSSATSAAWAASAARTTSATSAAWAASAARTTSATSAAWAASAVSAAWAASAAGAASAASAAWAAWAASAAWLAWAAWDASELAVLAAGSAEIGNAQEEARWTHVLCALEAGLWLFWVTESEIICAVIPDRVCFDDRRRLHCEDGPAFVWLRDVREYYLHGVKVPEHIVMRPGTISIAEIDAEPNAEVRRVMIERYGQSRYLLDSGAVLIHSDDYGTLYRKNIPEDEPLVMVKVVNSTPEADGSFKDYFLRVPPTMTRAREAVAWTFGKEEADYSPLIET